MSAVKSSRTDRIYKGRSLKKLLFTFSAPAIVGVMVNAFYNIINRVFVGHVIGSIGIAAITLQFPLAILFAAFGMMVGLGSNVLFAISLGKKDRAGAEQILGNAFIVLFVVATVLSSLTLIFVDPVLKVLGADAEVMPYAKDYVQVIMWGVPFNAVLMGFNSFLRSIGRPSTAMWTLIISAIVNVVLDALFIWHWGWGVKGAALASVIAQVTAFIWVMSYFIGEKNEYCIRVKNFIINWTNMGHALMIGSAQFVMQFSISAVNLILNHGLIKYGGNLAVSAMGITTSVNTLLLMPIIGITQGMQPIIGYNYGARKYKIIVQTLRLAIYWSTAFLTVSWFILHLFATPIVKLFNSTDPVLINMAAHTLCIFNMMVPFVGISVMASGFFQSTNQPKQAIFLALARQSLFLIPLLFILPLFFELEGVLWAGPVADGISAVVSFLMLRTAIKKLLNKNKKPA